MGQGCCGSNGIIMILPCSGGSSVGQLANQAAVELTREGFGRMFCLAGIGAHLGGFLRSARDVPQIVAIDGCSVGCARVILEHAEIPLKSYVVVTDLGIEKSHDFRLTNEDLGRVKEAVMEACRGVPPDADDSFLEKKDREIWIIGTDPPCPRCALLTQRTHEACRKIGISLVIRHIGYTDVAARFFARSLGKNTGTAKDVAGKAGIAVHWDRVSFLAGKQSAPAVTECCGTNASIVEAAGKWTPELDEILRPCQEQAESVGILMTPVLVVRGRVKHSGSVPSLEKIRRWIEDSVGEEL